MIQTALYGRVAGMIGARSKPPKPYEGYTGMCFNLNGQNWFMSVPNRIARIIC